MNSTLFKTKVFSLLRKLAGKMPAAPVENDRNEENDEYEWKIALFVSMATMWINDEGRLIFATKNGAQNA